MNTPTPPRKLLGNPRFFSFFVTQLLSAFNDNFFKTALSFYILHTEASAFGRSPAEMSSLVVAVFILPFFLFSAVAGQVADRFEKSRLVRLVKGAEIVIMLVAAAGFVMNAVPVLLLAIFAMGVHSAFLGPVKYGILPELLEADDLVVGNALVELGTFLAILGGTIGGSLLVVQDPWGPTVVGGAVVVFAVLGIVSALRVPEVQPGDPSVPVQWDLVRPTLQVLGITRRVRPVLLSVLGISWFWFFGACFLSVLPVYVGTTLGGEEEVRTVLLAVFCIGIATGSLLTERISGKNLELGLVPFGSIGMTLFTLDLFFVGAHPATGAARDVATFLAEPWAPRLLVDLAGIAIFGGFFTVPLYTLIQQRAEPSQRSRVVAGNNILNSLFMVVGSIVLAALFANDVPIPTMFLFVAALNAAVAVYIYSVVPEFLLRFLAWILSRILYRLRLDGHEHVPETGPVVLVCNHVSFIDWLIIAGSIRRPTRFVMDHRIAATPVVATLFRHAKTIPIAPQREDPALMEKAFERIAAELREGEVVCIFPEGKLTGDGRMNPFRAGIERILKETPVPVVPIALDGLWGSMFSRKDGPAMQKLPRGFRARLRLSIGEALPPERATAAELESRVRELLAREPRLDPVVETPPAASA